VRKFFICKLVLALGLGAALLLTTTACGGGSGTPQQNGSAQWDGATWDTATWEP